MKTREQLLYSLLTGLITTYTIGYHCFITDQNAYLATLMQLQDSALYARDFIIESNSGYGPRFFYLYFLLALSKILPINLISFILTLLANSLVIYITYSAASRICARCKHYPFIASILAASSVNFIIAGGNNNFIGHSLLPHNTAAPLVLLSTWFSISRRPYLCLISALVASLIHPLFGMEAGAIALLALIVSETFEKKFSTLKEYTGVKKSVLLKSTASILILAVFSVLVWVMPNERSINNSIFTDLMLYRAQHHIIPSTFRVSGWIQLVLFTIAIIMASSGLRNITVVTGKFLSRIQIILGIIIMVLICGWIFVEIIPSQLWISAMVYRNIAIFRWLGFLLIGLSAAKLIEQNELEKKLIGVLNLIGTGIMQQISMFLGQLLSIVTNISRRQNTTWNSSLFVIGFILIVSIIANILFGINRYLLLIILNSLVAYWFVKLGSSNQKRFFTLVLLFFVIIIPIQFRNTALSKVFPVVFTEADAQRIDPIGKAALFARQNTEVEDLFLTPPIAYRFRVWSRRSVFHDFKIFPYKEDAMFEWKRRYENLYGKLAGYGYDSLAEMEFLYKNITDDRLTSLAQQYNIDYAVLYSQTTTLLKTVYEDDQFKVVQLSDPDF